jgi:hypothetical protein
METPLKLKIDKLLDWPQIHKINQDYYGKYNNFQCCKSPFEPHDFGDKILADPIRNDHSNEHQKCYEVIVFPEPQIGQFIQLE